MNRHFFTAKREDFPDGDLGEAPRTQGTIGQIIDLDHAAGSGHLVAGGEVYFFHWRDFVHPDEFQYVLAGAYVTFTPDEKPWKDPRARRLELA